MVEAVGIERTHGNYQENQALRTKIVRTDGGTEGWVYFIQGRSGGLIKIGWANDVTRRLRQLQIGSPVPLRVLRQVPSGRGDEDRPAGQQHLVGELAGIVPGRAAVPRSPHASPRDPVQPTRSARPKA